MLSVQLFYIVMLLSRNVYLAILNAIMLGPETECDFQMARKASIATEITQA